MGMAGVFGHYVPCYKRDTMLASGLNAKKLRMMSCNVGPGGSRPRRPLQLPLQPRLASMRVFIQRQDLD